MQDEELAPRGAHVNLRSVAGYGREAHVVAIEAQRAVGVGDRKVYRAHPGGRRDRLSLHLNAQSY